MTQFPFPEGQKIIYGVPQQLPKVYSCGAKPDAVRLTLFLAVFGGRVRKILQLYKEPDLVAPRTGVNEDEP